MPHTGDISWCCMRGKDTCIFKRKYHVMISHLYSTLFFLYCATTTTANYDCSSHQLWATPQYQPCYNNKQAAHVGWVGWVKREGTGAVTKYGGHRRMGAGTNPWNPIITWTGGHRRMGAVTNPWHPIITWTRGNGRMGAVTNPWHPIITWTGGHGRMGAVTNPWNPSSPGLEATEEWEQ